VEKVGEGLDDAVRVVVKVGPQIVNIFMLTYKNKQTVI
jgi:hypothetical protein